MGSVSLFVAPESCSRCIFSLAAVKECHGDRAVPSVGIALKAVGYLARVDSASPSSVLRLRGQLFIASVFLGFVSFDLQSFYSR